MASRTTEARIHDTYVIYYTYLLWQYRFTIVFIYKQQGFSHEHAQEHVMRFNSTWSTLNNYNRNIYFTLYFLGNFSYLLLTKTVKVSLVNKTIVASHDIANEYMNSKKSK